MVKLNDVLPQEPQTVRLYDLQGQPAPDTETKTRSVYLSDLDMTVGHPEGMSTDQVNDAIQTEIYKRPRFNFYSDIVAPAVQSGLPGMAAKAGIEIAREGGARETAKAAVRGIEELPKGVGNLMRWFGENLTEQARLNDSPSAKAVADKITKWGQSTVDFIQKRQTEGAEAGDPEVFRGSFVSNPSWTRAAALVAQGLPSTAAAAAISFASGTPWAGAAALGLLEGSGEYAEAKDSGASQVRANAVFGANTVINTLLERLPLEEYLKGSGAIKGAVSEGVQEAVQSWAQNLIASIGYDKTRDLWQGTVESLIAGAGSGGMIGAFTSGRATQIDSLVQEAEKSGASYQDIRLMRDAATEAIIGKSEEVEAILDESALKTQKAQADIIKKEAAPFQLPESKTLSDLKDVAEEVLTPISSRLERIDPSLKSSMRKFEYSAIQAKQADQEAVTPFLQATKKIKKAEYAKLDMALKSGDAETRYEILKKYGIEKEYENLRKTLDEVHKRAEDVGLEIGYIEDYIPRVVKDRKGLMAHFRGSDNWSDIQIAINKKENEIGRLMSEDEKADFINTLIRGYGKDQIRLSKTRNMKERRIRTIDEDINKFYADSRSAIVSYLDNVNELIEARKFFGKKVKGMTPDMKMDNIIGAYVLNLMAEGKINSSNEQELTDILRARFNQRGTHGVIGTLKNLAYIDTMGSVTSAVTQIGDLAFSLYRGGFFKTSRSLIKALAGKSEISKAEIGIEKIAQEFEDSTKSAKAVSAVFKLVGLDYMDKLGKETLINTAFQSLQAEAKKPSPGFKQKMVDIFGDEAAQTTSDLKKGVASDNVKMLIFSELADVQPIALSEMPELYLKSGNGRVFYMLKTYSIKQIDVFRREVFDRWKDNPAEALYNLVRLSAALTVMNASADYIKDLIMGRPNEPEDYVIDNLIKLLGFSRYTIYKAKSEGVTQAAYSLALPPFRFIDSSVKDTQKIIDGDFDPKNAEIIQSIPIGGKLYYWWVGGGKAKMDKKNASIL